MSRDEIDELALYFRCPSCQEYGWCTTSSGKRAQYLHATRTTPVRQAFLLGVSTGSAQTLRSVPATRAAS